MMRTPPPTNASYLPSVSEGLEPPRSAAPPAWPALFPRSCSGSRGSFAALLRAGAAPRRRRVRPRPPSAGWRRSYRRTITFAELGAVREQVLHQLGRRTELGRAKAPRRCGAASPRAFSSTGGARHKRPRGLARRSEGLSYDTRRPLRRLVGRGPQPDRHDRGPKCSRARPPRLPLLLAAGDAVRCPHFPRLVWGRGWIISWVIQIATVPIRIACLTRARRLRAGHRDAPPRTSTGSSAPARPTGAATAVWREMRGSSPAHGPSTTMVWSASPGLQAARSSHPQERRLSQPGATTAAAAAGGRHRLASANGEAAVLARHRRSTRMLWKVFGRHIRPPLLSGAAHGRSTRQGSRRRFSPLRTAAARSCYFELIRANAELPGGTLGCSTSIRTLDVHQTG